MLETWIYVLLVKSFFSSNGVDHACALSGSDIKLFGSYDDACREKTRLQDSFYKQGYYVVDSGCDTSNSSLCYWTRVEKSEGFAQVLEIHKMSVMGDLFQVGRS